MADTGVSSASMNSLEGGGSGGGGGTGVARTDGVELVGLGEGGGTADQPYHAMT